MLGSGVFALMLCMGLSRFTYTPMITPMQVQTGMGDALAGWLAGWNYLGYFTGVLIITRMSSLYLKDRLYRIGMVLAVLTTFMMGFTESSWVWGISRYLAGLSTAAGMILGSGLILHWLIKENQHNELGLHFSGIGLGIACGALIVELSSNNFDWQQQWYLLGAFSCLLLVPALYYLPKPEVASMHSAEDINTSAITPSFSWLCLLNIAYFCSGFAYVVYTTFIVVIIEQEFSGQGVWLWCLLGIVAAPSAIFWDRVARRVAYVNALQLAFILKFVAIILVLITNSYLATMVSIICFGVTFVGIVSLVLTMVGVRFPLMPSQIMAKLTISFCIAQILGPVIAGEAAELSGSFDGTLVLSLILIIIGLFSLQLMKRSE